MATEIVKKRLRNLALQLQELEIQPFQGRSVSQNIQLDLGCQVFGTFLELGIPPTESTHLLSIYHSSESHLVKDIIDKVTSHQVWLQTFVSVYYTTKVDFEFAVPAEDICRTRSGIQYLLDLFQNLDSQFDIVLRDLHHIGEVESGFDKKLKSWITNGYRDLDEQDIPSGVHANHWWWF